MAAEDDGFGLFGKDFAFGIASDEDSGDFFGDALATADTLNHSGFLGKGPDFC